MTPLVSVIVPCYNGGRFLAETLRSVLDQTLRDLEVILVDDGSTDGTPAVAASLNDLRLLYVRQPNQGPAAARNNGYLLSRGRFLAFLDADDVWHPDMLARCVAVLERSPAATGAVTTDYRYIDSAGTLLPWPSGWRPWRGDVFERLLLEIVFCGPAILWRRECYEHIGGFDLTPEVNDDWVNWLRIAGSGFDFECVSDQLVSIRRHDSSITRTQTRRVIQWELHALDAITSEFAVAPELAAKAYARVYFDAVQQALTDGDYAEARGWLVKAVVAEPEVLDRDTTYYALAYGEHFMSVDAAEPLDLTAAHRHTVGMLEGLFREEVPAAIASRHTRATARALLCLGRIAYSQGASRAARRYAIQAIALYPGSLFQPGVLGWLGRIGSGRPLVRRARTALQRVRTQ